MLVSSPAESDFEDKSGLADIALLTLSSPTKLKSRFLWGIGPTFIFPTASKDERGGLAPNPASLKPVLRLVRKNTRQVGEIELVE